MKNNILFPRQPHPFFPESIKLSDFEEMKILGKGSYGQVGRYRYRPTNKQYAIKRIPLQVEGKKDINRKEIEVMTEKQLEVLYKVQNEHIVKIIDHFEEKDTVMLITEYIQGNNLYDQTMTVNKAVGVEQAANIAYQICQGLEELHSNYIIHRDLKLQNVMYLQQTNLIKIVDLGCSNYYGEDINRKTTIGTKPYWSPELVNHEKQDDRLDVWCLGVIIYEILFLESPFKEPNMRQKIRNCQYLYPETHNHEVELEDIFKKIFVEKNKRLRIKELKNHPFFRKYCPDNFKIKPRFEDIFSEEIVDQYTKELTFSIQKTTSQTKSIKERTISLEAMLSEMKKQMRKQAIK